MLVEVDLLVVTSGKTHPQVMVDKVVEVMVWRQSK
jgi:hypothetical protein